MIVYNAKMTVSLCESAAVAAAAAAAVMYVTVSDAVVRSFSRTVI